MEKGMKEGVKGEHVPDLRVRQRVALVDPPAEAERTVPFGVDE